MENYDRQRQSASVELSTCKSTCEAEIRFTRPLPKDSPIRVTFKMSHDGLLFVYGLDLTTNQDAKVEKRTDAIMKREEVEAAKEEMKRIRVTG